MGYSTAINADRKICATCQYWHGDREVKFNSTTDVRVRYNGGSADCDAWNQKKGAGFCCARYKRWLQLP